MASPDPSSLGERPQLSAIFEQSNRFAAHSSRFRCQMTSGAHFRPQTVFVTGGAGFVGSNLVRWILEHEPEVAVVSLDALTYAGNLDSVSDVSDRFGHAGDGR